MYCKKLGSKTSLHTHKRSCGVMAENQGFNDFMWLYWCMCKVKQSLTVTWEFVIARVNEYAVWSSNFSH